MRMLRTNDWKLVRYYHTNGLDELYDLKSDPGELTNLSKDPQLREVRARLQQQLEERMKVIRDPIVRESQSCRLSSRRYSPWQKGAVPQTPGVCSTFTPMPTS